MKLFSTQEIGSIRKPDWYSAVKGRKSLDSRQLKDLRKWSSLLKIDPEIVLALYKIKDSRLRLLETRKVASLFTLRLQESAGLDILWDGEVWRSEMYEDLAREVGLNFVSDYRSVLAFDDNYYRPAVCSRAIEPIGEYSLEEFRFIKAQTTRRVKIPITDAHTMALWSYNDYYCNKQNELNLDPKQTKYEARRDLTLDLARGPIRASMKRLVEAGAEIIQLDGPAAITDMREFDKSSLKRLGHDLPLYVEAFNAATDAIDCEFHVHICFPPDRGYESLFPFISEMKNCKQFSLEFANRDSRSPGTSQEKRTAYSVLNEFREYADSKNIGLGVIDIHSDFVEPTTLVRDRVLFGAKILGDPERVIVTTDCGLRTRSWDIAYSKLRNQVHAAELARRSYE